jgi:hypothetical protein
MLNALVENYCSPPQREYGGYCSKIVEIDPWNTTVVHTLQPHCPIISVTGIFSHFMAACFLKGSFPFLFGNVNR